MTLFLKDVISALAVVSFDVFNEMIVVFDDMLVVFRDTFEVLAEMAFLSVVMCSRLSAMSLVFVAMSVVFVEISLVFVDCWLDSFMISVVLFVTLFSRFFSVVDEVEPPFRAVMADVLVAISFWLVDISCVFCVMLALFVDCCACKVATSVLISEMLLVFPDSCVVLFDMLPEFVLIPAVFVLILAVFVLMLAVLVAIFAELADDVLPVLSVAMSAVLVVMLPVFVLILLAFSNCCVCRV